MHDLIAFLRARIDEDEAGARQAFAEHNDAEPQWSEIWSGAVQLGSHEDVLLTHDAAVSRHIARHDPARELADVNSKRRILELHTGAHDCTEVYTGTYPDDWPQSAPWGSPGGTWRHVIDEHFEDTEPCPTLRLLALPYADHPDYRDEWRP